MANYNLVSNAVVEPISLERFMQPVLAYTQARDAMEEKYGLMLDEASRYEAMKDTLDNDSYLKYKEFKDIADSGLNAIMSSNFTPLDKAKLMQARRSYAQNIKPLNEQFKKREEEAMLMHKAKLSNPNIRFSRDARNTKLSSYANGMPDIQVIDGDKVTALAAQLATPYAQTLLEDKVELEKVLPYQYRDKIQHGLTPQQLLLGLAESMNGTNLEKKSLATKIVSTLQKQVYDSTGIASWDEKSRNNLTPWLMNRINMGLNNLVGKAAYDKWSDDYNKELALAIAKKTLEDSDKNETLGSLDYQSRNIYTQEELSKYKDDWKILSQYLYKENIGDSKKPKYVWRMNDAGRRLYDSDWIEEGKNAKGFVKEQGVQDRAAGDLRKDKGVENNKKIPGTYRSLVDSYGLQGIATGKSGPSQNSTLDKISNAVNGQYDAKGNSEHYRKIDNSQFDTVNSMLHSIADKNGEIDNYKYAKDSKGNLTLVKDKKVKVKDLKGSDIASVQTVVGKHGSYYEITLIGSEDKLRIPIKKFSSSFSYAGTYKETPVEKFIELKDQGYDKVTLRGNDISIDDALRGGISDYLDAGASIIGTTQVEPRKISGGIQ